MSYKVDGTKVNTLSTLLGRVIHASAGVLAGSLTKGTIMKTMHLKNEISVVGMIEHRKGESIDEGVIKKGQGRRIKDEGVTKKKSKSAEVAPIEQSALSSKGVEA